MTLVGPVFTGFLEGDVASDTTMPRVGDVCSQPV
jgi:hypothetical protein